MARQDPYPDQHAGQGRDAAAPRRFRQLALQVGLVAAAAAASFPLLLSARSGPGEHAAGSGAAQEEAARERQRRIAAETGKVGKAIKESHDLRKEGKLAEALHVLEVALDAQTVPVQRATLLVAHSQERSRQRQLEAALADLEAADRELASEPGPTATACAVHNARSRIYYAWGLLDRALEEVRTGEALLAELDKAGTSAVAEHINAHVLEAEIQCSRQAYAELEAHVTEVLGHDEFRDNKNPRFRDRLGACLGVALKEIARLDTSRTASAREHLERVLAGGLLDTTERLQPELALAELALRAADWKTAADWIEIADGRIDGSPEERLRHPMFLTWKSLQARLVFERKDAPASGGALAEMRDELAEVHAASLAEFAGRELRPGGYGYLLYGDSLSLLSELIRLEITLEPGAKGTERALEHLLAVGSVGTLARTIGAPPVDLARVREVLLGGRADQALLVYFPSADRSHLFVIRASSVVHVPLAAWDFIDRARLKSCETLARPLDPKAAAWEREKREKALRELAEHLLPPEVREVLASCKRIGVVREFLGDVPFEALASADGRTLGTTHAITHLPSPAVGVALVERARREDRRAAAGLAGAVALVGAPESARDGLEGVDFNALLAAYPEAARAIRTGREATPERFAQAMAGARVTQIFAHGRLRRERERTSAIQLDSPAQPGGVTIGADEIEHYDASPLVLLMVCKSAAGPKRRGDGSAADLAGAIFSAGMRARCVVQSSFDIEVRAAVYLSRHFHAALVAGEDPAEAMRQARAALAAMPGFEDPFYHGLIQVVGAGDVPLFAK